MSPSNAPLHAPGGAAPAGSLRDRPDLAALMESYLAHVRIEKRLSARTVDICAQALQQLQSWALRFNCAAQELQPAQLRQAIANMHAKGLGPSSIRLKLSCWRGFYRWLGQQGRISHNPLDGVRPPQSVKALPPALCVDEAVQLAAYRQTTSQDPPAKNQDKTANTGQSAARRGQAHQLLADSWSEARIVAIVELLYGSGLRMAELTGLDVQASSLARGWLDLSEAQVHVLGKGSKRRTAPIGQAARVALQNWLSVRTLGLFSSQAIECSSALFINRQGRRLSAQSIRQQLKARAQDAGLSRPVHPHMLRHSFASHLLQSSGDLRAVQELLGHSNIRSTQVYTRLDFQHLAQVYNAAHPRA